MDLNPNHPLILGLHDIIHVEDLNEFGQQFIKNVFIAIYNNIRERNIGDEMTIIFPPFGAYRRYLVGMVAHLFQLHIMEIKNQFNSTYIAVSTKRGHTLQDIQEIDALNCQFSYLVIPVPPPPTTRQTPRPPPSNTTRFNFVRTQLETIPEVDEEVDLSDNEEKNTVEGKSVENTSLLGNKEDVKK